MYNAITNAEIQVDQPIKQELMQKIKDNFDDHQTRVGSLTQFGIPNGSFEIDSDADDRPDTWTINTYSGGVAGLSPSTVLGTDGLEYTCIADHTADSTNQPVTGASWATYWVQTGQNGASWQSGKSYQSSHAHGAKSLYFIHSGVSGSGGGFADSDYMPCSPQVDEVLGFLHWATNAAMDNRITVRYYDKDKIYLSEVQLYSSTNNPTTGKSFFRVMSPPENAQFYKIRVIGGHTDTNQPGTAFFDGLRILPELPDSQVRSFVPLFLDSFWTGEAYGNANVPTFHHHYAVLTPGNAGGVSGYWFSRIKLTNVIPNLIASQAQLRFEAIITNMTSLTLFAGAHFYVTQQNPGASSRASATASHFGFRIDSAANILASNADGTTESATDTGTDLTTGTQFTVLEAILNPGVDVRYFINGTWVATQTTNLPVSGDYRIIFELDNADDPSGAMTLHLPNLIRQK